MTYSNDITNKARHDLGGRCKHCGTRRSLEFAHIYFNGYKDVNKNGRRLSGRSLVQKHTKFNTLHAQIMLLCTTCHRKYDTITMADLAAETLYQRKCENAYRELFEDD